MVNVFLVLLSGKFPGKTEILKRLSCFRGGDFPNANSFTILYKFLEVRLSFVLVLVLVSCCN